MKIDLSALQNQSKDYIDISGEYQLDSSYYEKSEIIDLKPVIVRGKIIQKENEFNSLDEYMECHIQGSMIILDSISLEEIEYPFEIEYDDFIEKNTYFSENILDIFEFLWENILLEVPLHYTKVEDLHNFHGDGWKLIQENEVRKNNPFSDLLKDFEKE